jgi:hypothetical protein
MQANPEKFQAIAIGKKTFDKSPIFQIGTANISCDEVVKFLAAGRELNPAEHLSVYLPMC